MLSRAGKLTNEMKPPPGMIFAGSGDVVDSGEVQVPARGGLPPRAFRRVREYIFAHSAENISNRALAQLAGLSSSHFARAFKQSAGVSPHRFVLTSRVERVKHLLAETDLPLAQIAVTAGFADQSHCTRRFRELVGMTPSRFRWLRR
jgi:transcriptional regulator GlxA family with amidase domain